MNNTKTQTKATTEKTPTLIEEYNNISDDILNQYSTIRGYHYQNNEWRAITNGYGVELELQNDDYNIKHKLARFLNYKYKMNIEQDGSLSNSSDPLEIISQPYSQEEWLNNKDKVKEFFELIKTLGLYEDDQTGLHIHISKKLIGKNDTIRENNINKLILILENYKDTFTKFTRRDKTQLKYCNFMSNYNMHKTYKDLYSIKKNKYYSHNTCINMDTKTYEIRIFKATTDYNTFIATLELVINLVKVINQEDISNITFNDIINLNSDFKELIDYCKENKISNGTKIIDKTKIKEILQLKENSKILKENYNYNRYIDKVRTIVINNMELYKQSEDDYNKNSDLYNNLSYIFTKTYKNNNSIYYTIYEINNLLSRYSIKYISNLKTNTTQEKRVFNEEYKNKYNELMTRLEKLITINGGVL